MKATLLFSIFFVLVLSACSTLKENQPVENKLRIDGLGREISLPNQPRRILPLAPSLTEMLFALVPDSHIIAVTPNCNFPPESVSKKQKVEIYPLDIERILELKPDIIFTEVGMITTDNLARLDQLHLPVFVFRYGTSAELLSAMDSIKAWLPNRPNAGHLMDSLHRELIDLEKESQEIPNENRPKVLALTYFDPIFAYGFNTWMTDKIRLAGGQNALNTQLDKPYPTLEREQILKLNPDVIFGGTFEEMDTKFFNLYPELRRVNAWKSKRIYSLTDDLASRPSPRLFEGIQEIKVYLQK